MRISGRACRVIVREVSTGDLLQMTLQTGHPFELHEYITLDGKKAYIEELIQVTDEKIDRSYAQMIDTDRAKVISDRINRVFNRRG